MTTRRPRPFSDYDRALLAAVGRQLQEQRTRAPGSILTAHDVAQVAGVPVGTVETLERGECRRLDAFHRVQLALATLGRRRPIDYGRAHLDACESIGIDPVTDGGAS